MPSAWRPGLALALVAAAQRGVAAKVIVDDTTRGLDGTEYPTPESGQGTDRSAPSWVLACPAPRGCIADRGYDGNGSKGIGHNKVFLPRPADGLLRGVLTAAPSRLRQRAAAEARARSCACRRTP